MAFFMTFGIRDHHLERYLRYLRTRTYMVEIWQNSEFAPDVVAAAERAGIEVMDLNQEARKIPLELCNVGHVELHEKAIPAVKSRGSSSHVEQ